MTSAATTLVQKEPGQRFHKELAASLVADVIALAIKRGNGTPPPWTQDPGSVAALQDFIAYFETFESDEERLERHASERARIDGPNWRPLLGCRDLEDLENQRAWALENLEQSFKDTLAEHWITYTRNYIPPAERAARKAASDSNQNRFPKAAARHHSDPAPQQLSFLP